MISVQLSHRVGLCHTAQVFFEMSLKDYRAFIRRLVEARVFSKLSAEDQSLIILAEKQVDEAKRQIMDGRA